MHRHEDLSEAHQGLSHVNEHLAGVRTASNPNGLSFAFDAKAIISCDTKRTDEVVYRIPFH